jgi:choline dehydrogenase-like flavoprotein
VRGEVGDLFQVEGLFDVVVVGGGAAGLTLAAELDGSGLKVAVLEGGGDKPSAASQALYEGELADPAVHPWLHHYRVRALGGASRIWGGRCLPYDPIDFADRPWAPGPGWPFGLEVLAPYYVRAQVAAEAGPFDYDPAHALPGQPGEFAPGVDGDRLATRLERFSKPTDFAKRWGEKLQASANVHLILNASLTAVRLAPDGRQVDHLEVAAPDGRRTQVRARSYVLAMGGLETPRILLASNDVIPAGVGGGSDQLGRNYMSHLAATSGVIRFNAAREAVRFDYERDAGGVYVRRRLTLTEAAQRELQSLNIAFRTNFADPADPAHGHPVLSAMFLVKDLVLLEYSRKMRERRVTMADRLRHVGNVASQPVALARFGIDWVRRRILAERKLPSVVLSFRDGAFPLEFHAEQAANPDSRLTLTDTHDALGVPRLRADLRCTELDLESVRRSYALLASELERTGAGRLDYDPEHLTAATRAGGAYGGHHIGAARMSRDPAQGVVDPDGRVHGVANLYLAGAAVLPTSSQANPTLTLLALALRLADRLKAAPAS